MGESYYDDWDAYSDPVKKLTFYFHSSGFIWGEIKEMWDGGFTEYIHDWWNLMDFAMNSLYLATISLKIVAYVKVIWNVCYSS